VTRKDDPATWIAPLKDSRDEEPEENQAVRIHDRELEKRKRRKRKLESAEPLEDEEERED
jgi:hypothetical protein